MADLGDISSFMKEGNVVNLDWLDVNEQDYQKLETLPKQNLDIAPDLEALWARDDGTPQKHMPNRADLPKTVGDLSEVHGHLRGQAEEIRKVARLAVMQSDDPTRIMDALLKRFDRNTLRASREVIAETLAERGLLGRLYIDAADFPQCDRGSKQPIAFVRRYAGEAKYVVSKQACEGCSCSIQGPNGPTCATFHKEIKVNVPYTEAVAAEVERLQAAKGKIIQASSDKPPRERIRLAMLAPTSTQTGPRVYAAYGQPGVPAPVPAQVVEAHLTEDIATKMAAEKTAELTLKAQPVVAFLRREMLKGRSEPEAQYALKLAFQPPVLEETAPLWVPVMKQAGVYGVVYATQDSFGDCHEGADFLSKHNAGVRTIVRGSKCDSCIYAKVSRCLIYGKPLVASVADVLTPETVDKVLTEHKFAGRIAPWDNRHWGDSPMEALQNIHKVAMTGTTQRAQTRMDVVKGYYGQAPQHSTDEITRRNIVLATQQFMNEGLYGSELLMALKAKFEPRDLKAATPDIRPIIAEQGLQGIYYINPEVYDDYGKGCEKAAALHRSRLVPYVKAGSKCGSCIFQAKSGHCSKLNKPVVVEPPYADKTAQQREILASGRSTQVSYASLVNNGLSMMAEYEIQKKGMEIELDPVIEAKPLDISFK